MITLLENPSPEPASDAVHRWVLAVAPTEEERAELMKKHGAPAEFVRHSLDSDERPHMERLEGTWFIVLRVPCAEPPGAPSPYATIPLGLIVREKTMVLVCGRETRLVTLLGAQAQASAWRQRPLVLKVLRLAADMFLGDLKAIDTAVDALEDRLRESLENREVLELLRQQKALVYFATALESNLLVVERLQRDTALPVGEGDGEALEDALVELRQALDVAKISRDILSEMMDAFASIISNNLNNVMRFLAAVTVVLTVPVLLASFWGMNLEVPLGGHGHGFALLVLVSFVLSLVLVVVFRRKRWL